MIDKLEELDEEQKNPILEPYIIYEESTMVGEGEGKVHNVNDEHLRIGGGGPRIWGGGGGRGRGRGVEDIVEPNLVGFPILDEDTTTTTKIISPSILPNFHGLEMRILKHFFLN